MPKMKMKPQEKAMLQVVARIDYYKRMRGLDNEDIMAAADICPKTYRTYMNDAGEMRLKTLARIANKLNVSVKTLLIGGDEI